MHRRRAIGRERDELESGDAILERTGRGIRLIDALKTHGMARRTTTSAQLSTPSRWLARWQAGWPPTTRGLRSHFFGKRPRAKARELLPARTRVCVVPGGQESPLFARLQELDLWTSSLAMLVSAHATLGKSSGKQDSAPSFTPVETVRPWRVGSKG